MEKDVSTKKGLSDGSIRFIIKKIAENKVEWFSTKNGLFIILFSEPLSEKRIYRVENDDIQKLKEEIMTAKAVSSILDFSSDSFTLEYADRSKCVFFTKKDGTKIINYNK